HGFRVLGPVSLDRAGLLAFGTGTVRGEPVNLASRISGNGLDRRGGRFGLNVLRLRDDLGHRGARQALTGFKPIKDFVTNRYRSRRRGQLIESGDGQS